MPNFSSINFLNNNKKIVISENGKLPELDGSLLKNIKKLDVNSYENVGKLVFTNARLNADSTDGDVINVDTSMNVENESIDNLGNPLILRGNFIGNSENTVLLYTGDNTETVSNNITTLTNIALNKDYLGDVTTYNTSNILTYDNVPPIYGQNSEGHKSFGMDISDKDIKIQYTNSFSEYVKVSYWYYISSGTKISKTSYFELGTHNGDHMGIFYYDVASNKIKFLGNYTKTLIVSIEKDKWHYVELCLKLNEKNKAKVYHDGNYIGEETSTTINSWNNTDGIIYFKNFIQNAFNFDQLMVNISSEEEYNNFENTEHPIPTSASEVIKSTSFVINDIDTVPEDGKLFIKSKNQTYTISPSLIGGGSSSLNVNEYQNINTLSFPNAIVSQDAENTKKLIVKTQNIFKVLEFPSADMINNSIYVLASGETKAYFENEWINISPEIVETIDESATNNNIPTTLAVKNYINTQLESSIDLSNYYNKTESDEKFALKENTVSYTFTTENSLNTIPITNGQAVICEDSEKLYIDKTDTRISIGDLIIVEASADLPETPLNKLYFVKETDKLYIYSNNTWVSINPNQFIDPNRLLPSTAENGNLLQYYIETGDLVTPTGLNKTSQQDGEDWTITYENFADKQVGSYWYAIFDGDTQYNSTGKRTAFNLPAVIQWKSNKEKKILNKLRIYPTRTETSGEYRPYYPPATFKLSGSNDGQVWTTLLDVYQYRWPGDNEYKFTYSNIYHDWFFENNTGYLYYKLDITEVSSVGVIHNNSSGSIDELQGYGEARGWRLISVDDIKADIALDLSNYQQENNISIASTNGSISLSGTDFVINGNTSNTSGGLAIVEDSGKLPTSIIPESTVDLSNYHGGFKVITDEAEGPILIQGSPITLLGYELTLQSTHGNMILNTGYDIDIDARVCDIYGTYIKLSTSQNSLTFNGAELNTPGGLVCLDSSGKISASLIPEQSSNSISVGNGLIGDGTESNPLKLDLSNYSVDTEIDISSSGANGGISIRKGSNGLEIINDRVSLTTDSVSFTLGEVDVKFNGNSKNTAGGFAVVQENGKLPSSIIPEQLETTSMEIVESSGTSFTLVNGKVFAHTLSADEVLAFDTSGFRAGICATCELWLTMPSDVVSFSFPETLVWVDGSAPSIDAGDMQYVIVLRWDGERLIANLAYSVEVA